MGSGCSTTAGGRRCCPTRTSRWCTCSPKGTPRRRRESSPPRCAASSRASSSRTLAARSESSSLKCRLTLGGGSCLNDRARPRRKGCCGTAARSRFAVRRRAQGADRRSREGGERDLVPPPDPARQDRHSEGRAPGPAEEGRRGGGGELDRRV